MTILIQMKLIVETRRTYFVFTYLMDMLGGERF